jgi:hypothetical protein
MPPAEHIRSILESKDSTVTAIALVIQLLIGPAAWEMEPIEVMLQLEAESSYTLSSETVQRIEAFYALAETPAFFDDPNAFVGICNTLASGSPVDDIEEGLTVDSVSVPEMLWAIYEVSLHYDDMPSFSPAVMRMIQEVTASEAEDPDNPGYADRLFMERLELLRRELTMLEVPAETIAVLLDGPA